MNNNDLVAKLWKLCDNLRDGGVSYQNYVNELASLLFLKMCKETGQEADYLPEGYRWDDLKIPHWPGSDAVSTVTCWFS
ncbi:type I restriction-modification system [Klebsiella pneumoniae]|uniref:Type I restriction-modification system n=1 Tax=Klebsiella pneumoniae TaxID=573 RepID=A0A377UUG2_KLEPN|nr:type I restriction-modification system [Klebsiella pneumoniae]